MQYVFEQRISTLAQNAVMKALEAGSFVAEGIELSHWAFNINDGWTEKAWLARASIDAASLNDAWNIFRSGLERVVPRIAFISQCYTEYLLEPFIAIRPDINVAFLRYTQPRGSVPLMFGDEEQEALALLLRDSRVPEEFFYYWNDAVNAIGYGAKLLLMFAALEVLIKEPDGTKVHSVRTQILGEELSKALYKNVTGLRHRLNHGEYFAGQDSGIDYLHAVHKRVLGYFNERILEKELLDLHVVSPQRHLFGNVDESRMFIQPADPSARLCLKDVLQEFSSGKFYSERYPIVDERMRNLFLGICTRAH